MLDSKINLIENPISIDQSQLTFIPSGAHSNLYKKMILGSLIISFSFIPNVATNVQNSDDTNNKYTNLQYEYNANDSREQFETSMNKFIFSGYNPSISEYNLSIKSLRCGGSEEGVMKNCSLTKQIQSNILRIPKKYKEIEDDFVEINEKINKKVAKTKVINSSVEYGGKINRRIL